jgi:hypothetical protein
MLFLVVRIAFAGTAFLGLAGCGLFSSRDPSAPEPAAPTPVLVAVENHNWNDITIYLLTAGPGHRLGMVTALGNATFEIPAHRLNTSGGLRLRALPVAGRPFTSETIVVMPGQVISWRLENDLDYSSLSVY